MPSAGKWDTKKIAVLGMLTALAVVFSYVEVLISFSDVLPGIKAGLSNCVVLAVLIIYGWKEAFTLNILRCLITAFILGRPGILPYSLSGAVTAVLVMSLAKKSGRFSEYGLSALGGIAHNTVQLVICLIFTGREAVSFLVFTYLPVLILAGTAAGLLCGAISRGVLNVCVYKRDAGYKEGRQDNS